MIEWHLRYFMASQSGKVSRAMNLSSGTSGGAPVFGWALGAPRAAANAAATCTNTSIVAIDDESYMHDTRPWPAKTRRLCAAPGWAPGMANFSSLRDPSLALETSSSVLARVSRFYHSVHDEMEDEQLLWLLHTLLAMLAVGLICCCWNCYGLVTDFDD
jgi:hypothetical protein